MASMTYGTYTWPHNPHTLNIRLSRRIAVHEGAFSGNVLQDMGEGVRICSGSGDFYGETAHADFYRLKTIFEQGGTALLSLPGHTPFAARFKSLEYTEKSGPQIISYDFSFVEDVQNTEMKQVKLQTYTAQQGDNLWTVSLKFNIEMNALLELNKNLSGPFDIKAGQTIKLY